MNDRIIKGTLLLIAYVISTGKSAFELREKYGVFSNRQCKQIEEYVNRFEVLLLEIFSLYNICDIVQNFYISKSCAIENIRQHHYWNFAKAHLTEDAIIMTTNYGNEIRKYYSTVEYIHGNFVDYSRILTNCGERIKKLNIKREDGYYKFFFAATPLNKHLVTDKGIYDDEFFLNDSRNYGDLLIFGLSFAKIHGDLEKIYDQTRKFDMIIDGHIMKRIDELFEKGGVNTVTIVAYNELDMQAYKNFLESYSMNDQTKIKELYDNKKILLVSENKFSLGKIKYGLLKLKNMFKSGK